MSIDCKKFDLLEDAISEKNNLIKHFKEEHKGVEAKFIEEECGFFIRIAITNGILTYSSFCRLKPFTKYYKHKCFANSSYLQR